MNPDISVMKIELVESLGASAEEKLEKSRFESVGAEAAAQVLKHVQNEMNAIMGSIEVDTRSGQLAPAHNVVAKKYVKKCVDFVENFLFGTQMKLFTARGKVSALEEIVKDLEGTRDSEQSKLDSFREAQRRMQEELLKAPEPDLVADSDHQEAPRKSSPPRMDVARSLGIDSKKKRR